MSIKKQLVNLSYFSTVSSPAGAGSYAAFQCLSMCCARVNFMSFHGLACGFPVKKTMMNVLSFSSSASRISRRKSLSFTDSLFYDLFGAFIFDSTCIARLKCSFAILKVCIIRNGCFDSKKRSTTFSWLSESIEMCKNCCYVSRRWIDECHPSEPASVFLPFSA